MLKNHLLVGLLATIAGAYSANAQQAYVAPSEALWNQMVQAADQISMPGPSNRQLMQLFQQVQHQAQVEAAQARSVDTQKKPSTDAKP